MSLLRRSRGILLRPFAAALLLGAIGQRALAAQPAAGRDTVRLSLADAITRAMRDNGDVRSAAAQIDLLASQIGTARAGGLPTVNLTGNYSRFLQNARADAVGQVFNQPITYTANARANWTVFQGGAVVFGIVGAQRARSASEYTLAEARATVTLGVQRAYLGARVAAALDDIQRENLTLVAARLTLAEQRLASGQSSRYDVLRARVELANAEPLAIAARNQRDLALLDLRRLLNLLPNQPLVLTDALDVPAIAQAAPAAVATVTDDEGRRRPSLLAADLRLRASNDGIWAARAAALPTVNVFYQYGYLAFPTSGFPPGEGQIIPCPGGITARTCNNGGWFRDRQYGLFFSWPIWDGLRAKAGIDRARAQRDIARVGAEQTAIDVAAEIARAKAEVERARAAFTAQRAAASEAAEVYELAVLRQARGLGTALEVSDAGLNRLTARSNEARAGTDLWLALADLERARGRAVPLPPVRLAGAPSSVDGASKDF